MRRSTSAGIADNLAESRVRCRQLAGFIREAWHVLQPETQYVHGWHIDVLCAHLEAISNDKMLATGHDNRLLINIPPGSMKSLTVMVFWLAWEWGPAAIAHLQAICTSYREDFCVRDSIRFRKLVTSEWYQARWPLEFTKLNESKVENTQGGFRETMPFTSLLGGRADRILIDDPHSLEGTESEPERERAIRNFRETGVLRLNDPKRSAIVIIMQRLHMKDLSGTILELGLPYIHLRLPMRFELPGCVTPFGKDRRTKEGELLFPERFPKTVLDRDEKAMTAYAVASQHQQRPAPRGGLMFKPHWFKVVPASPAYCRRVRGWDLAASETKDSAWTAGVRLAYDAASRTYFVEDVVRERISNPEGLIRRVAERDGKDVEISIPQDPGGSGKIQARAIVAALSGYRIQASPESGSKEQRAMPVAAQAEVGNMAIVKGSWNEQFLDELETFPTGYMDQVDALSRAFGKFVLSGRVDGFAPAVFESHPIQHFGEYPSGTI